MNKQRKSLNIIDAFLKRIEAIPASDRLILRVFFFAIVGSLIFLILVLNNNHSALVATRGGTIKEAILGTPRFVNPALAITRADQDVTALVYSGLLKISPQGTLTPDVAESITVSEDGLTYNIVVRKDAAFHDGVRLTAKDVAFTIRLIQDPDLKSPLRGNWSDVTVEEIGEYELNVVLEEAYAPFMENFTVGIMPAHLWSNLPIEQLPFSQLNTEPIGSGPFQIDLARRDASGLINSYELTAFKENSEGPKISNFEILFYANEADIITALNENLIDSTAYLSTSKLSDIDTDLFSIIEEPLPRVFGIFFNQNRSTVLRDDAARQALSLAINRDTLIDIALQGHGVPITSPTTILQNELKSTHSDAQFATNTISTAAAVLEAGDWEQNELGFWEKEIDKTVTPLEVTIRTSNAPLFVSILDSVVADWRTLGINVNTEQFEQTGLVQSVIRPRDFESLLFGLDMSRSYDLYPFWHSSQKDDPGLNIAQYTNLTVDKLLGAARTEQNGGARATSLIEADEIITEEVPAVFLFQPNFTYVVSKDISFPEFKRLGKASDRFSNTNEWHTKSDTLWPIFQDKM